MPSIIHDEIQPAVAMALFAFKVAEAEQWRVSRSDDAWAQESFRRPFRNDERPAGTGDKTCELAENPAFR